MSGELRKQVWCKLVDLALHDPDLSQTAKNKLGPLVRERDAARVESWISEAVDAGATLSTHLGNGAHGTLRRHPNYLWQQLAADGLSASIICDGHHLPAAVVKTIVRAKTPRRVILVSDAASLAGLPPGRYRECEGEVEVLADGRIVIAGQEQLLAGSTQSIDRCLGRCMEFAGVSLSEAVDMATVNPARLLGLPYGGFQPGDAGDFVLFRHEKPSPGFEVVATVAAGEVRFGSLGKKSE